MEYKLRRQQQEKKKKKQNREQWLQGGNSSAFPDSGPSKGAFGEVRTTSELTFDDQPPKAAEVSKFDTDRPANKQEEDLQLEVFSFFSIKAF